LVCTQVISTESPIKIAVDMTSVWIEIARAATARFGSLAERALVHYNQAFMAGRNLRRTANASRARAWSVRAGVLAVLVGCAALACRSHPPLRVVPVEPSASEALAEAQLCLRAADPRRRERALELAQRAVELAPDWVAPARLIDDVRRDELRGIEALQEHRSRLARMDDRTPAALAAGELYLAGRLEGFDGKARFEQAVRIDPDLAWGYHGLSWVASVTGEPREALAESRLALARARDSWERSFFTASLARALVAADSREEAEKILLERMDDPDTRPADRVALEQQSVETGLESLTSRQRSKSYERGLSLLRRRDLDDAEIESLVAKLRLSPSPDDPDLLALESSLAVERSAVRDRLRAELMLESAPTPLALGLLERGVREEKRAVPAGALMRAARFAAGQYARAIEVWLAELPACVLTSRGLPADPRLTRVVDCARKLERASAERSAAALEPPAREDGSRSVSAADDALADLGEALVSAGWFREARSVAGELAGADLDRALTIESRALAGQDLIDGVRRLVRKVDLEQGSSAPASQADIDTYRVVKDGEGALRFELLGDHTGVHDLHSLLAAMAPSFARAHVFLGGDGDLERVKRELVDSPRMSYGPIGELVHPGPSYSRTDEKSHLGRSGDAVPGLASELDRIGRFGLFGEVAGGGGPDGTLLPRIYVEHKEGAHLGVPWSGTVVWCERAELKSRAGRRGAHISAAALHEGYWVDIDAVRGERALWSALRREFSGPGSRERIARVLAVRGLELESSDPERRSRERTKSGFLLGEGQRVRLALLVERGAHERFDAAPGSDRRDADPRGAETKSGVQRASAADAQANERASRNDARANEADARANDSDARANHRVGRASEGDMRATAAEVHATTDDERANADVVPLGDVGLDELVTVTSTHEEGHLCDRTRFLPLGKHLGAGFLFLLDCGFSPKKVTEMLEYRAQLTCLCDSPDPRVPLAQVLDAAEQGPSGITPHGSGYTLLLSDLLDVFDAALARDPNQFPRIDPGFTLAHQMHKLGAEEVRTLALSLAHKKRLSR
jgi:tetratricopeptide (TPR) repeat protein